MLLLPFRFRLEILSDLLLMQPELVKVFFFLHIPLIFAFIYEPLFVHLSDLTAQHGDPSLQISL